MKIAVILPTRGMYFVKAYKALINGLIGFNYHIFTTTGHNASKARNLMVKKALKSAYTHFLFIDDDVVLKKGVIDQMFNYDVASCQIPLKEGGSNIKYNPDGTVAWAGAGCLMVKREVIEKMKKPYFNSAPQWILCYYKDKIRFRKKSDEPSEEGGEDINFCRQLIKLKYEIKILPIILEHIEILKYASIYAGVKINSRHRIKIHKKI